MHWFPANYDSLETRLMWNDYSPGQLLQQNKIQIVCIGSPLIVNTPEGPPYVSFDGKQDGLILHDVPIAKARSFTVEIMIHPYAHGPFEQRFFHIQDDASDDRFLMEIRMLDSGYWYADSYFSSHGKSVLLQDQRAIYKSDQWFSYTVTYDGHIFSHSIDGGQRLEASFENGSLPVSGMTSIGIRANRVSPFYGKIGGIRFKGSH